MSKESLDLDGYFKVVTSEQGVFLTVDLPTGKGEKVKMEDVLVYISERGLAVDLDLVDQVVNKSLGDPVKIGEPQEEKKTGILIVEVMEDGMSAYLTVVPPPSGGSLRLTVEDIKDVLKKEGVIYGYDEKAILNISRQPEKELNRAISVAKGTLPVKGKDALIDYKFDINKDKVYFKEGEDGRVDYRELNLIENVQEGQLLAVKMPSLPGKPGMTVRGVEIPPEEGEGKDISLPAGKNTYISDDGLELYAGCTGRIVWNKSKIDIEAFYEIDGDVNYETGNIEFIGTVIIGKNVTDGFSIKAGGNIEIGGCVEKATVEAGGSVTIKNGVIGKEEGLVKAGRDVKANFIENATIIAGEDVIVKESIMHSNIVAGKGVTVYGKNKGVIVGGKVMAKDEVDAREIGSWAETETTIEVGIDPNIRGDLSNIEKEVHADKKSFEEIKQQIKTLSQQRDLAGDKFPPAKEELLTKYLRSRNMLMLRLRDTIERMNFLQKEHASGTGGRIRVFGTMYPGVKICIQNTALTIKSEYKFTAFTVKGGQIKLSPYN